MSRDSTTVAAKWAEVVAGGRAGERVRVGEWAVSVIERGRAAKARV